MSQTSKIMEVQANAILNEIFAPGYTIALFTSDPNTGAYTQPTSPSYQKYTINSGDFRTDGGAISTARHLLFGLALDEWASESNPVRAFGVYAGNTLIYWGMLNTPVPIPADTVPVFKAYNAARNEGIKVTLDVVATASASS